MIVIKGRPPIYWGVEQEAREANPRHFDGAWMVETLPPWRKSTKAVRIRIGDRALHVGFCKVMDEDDPLRGQDQLDATVSDIREWRRLGEPIWTEEAESEAAELWNP